MNRFSRRLSAAIVLSVAALLMATLWAVRLPHPARPAGESALPTSTDATTLPQGVDAGWWGAAQATLQQAEYHISWQEQAGAYQAPNRAHNLRATFTPGGVALAPRVAGGEGWNLAMRLRAVGSAQAMQPVAPATLNVEANRVELRRGEVVEWYVNEERGLEQGFTLAAPPGNAVDSPVQLELALEGDLRPALRDGGAAVEFALEDGPTLLRYDNLAAFDAMGRTLPARMSLSAPDTLRLTVDTAGAAYPITIDPLLSTPTWQVESDQQGALLGQSVATAGDVNGDGFSDVVIAAPFYDRGQVDEGLALLFAGSAAGLGTTPVWAFESDQSDARLGYSLGYGVNTAGDVNGDGFADVIVGAYQYDDGETDEGRAALFLGSAAGLRNAPDWSAEGNAAPAGFGYLVAPAGDVNGDGYGDVLIGALLYGDGQADEGRAYVYHGSANGLSATPAWSVESDQANAYFARSGGSAGDVNGDGYSDIVVGAAYYENGQTDEGRVYGYYGSPNGLSATADWSAESDQPLANFGYMVGGAGDVDGDDFSDVIVGAAYYDQGQADVGRAYLYRGSATGLRPTAEWTVTGDQGAASLGWSVGAAGDVNGDGYGDVLIGASYYDNGQSDEGRVYLYTGSANSLGTTPAWTGEGEQAGARYGFAATTAGDVNGDGYADTLIGAAYHDDGETDEGAAFALYGSPSLLPSSADWTTEGNQAGARLGESVATAGDVNGDGYSDLIVGAGFYDNGQVDEGRAFLFLGSTTGLNPVPAWSVEGDQEGARLGHGQNYGVNTAGDVNGDGFGDVLVGAYTYDNDQTDEGRAWLYLGSAAGLSNTPAWTGEGSTAAAAFGFLVAPAGDVNADGYGDVLIGSHTYTNGQANEGRAYLYLGSANGLGTTPAWDTESDQVEARFGRSGGTAGDVNGDGFGDVIVSAPFYDNGHTDEGRAYLYLGSAAGLSTTPAWTGESDQTFANFGFMATTAGDVNGDGFADVVVGAAYYDGAQVNSGRAYVYHGSAAGLGASAAWTVTGDQGGASLGWSVGTAGDANGDGFGDVIVGAPLYDGGQTDEGRAYLYAGSHSGLGSAPVWLGEGEQVGAQYGFASTTAGDVNGDGYSDLAVGALFFDNGQSDEGAAFVYHGAPSGLGVAAGWSVEGNQVGARLGNLGTASAGDVNGDGYADLIVSANIYDNGQTDEGIVYVYHGSPTGLSATPNWVAEGNQPDARFGAWASRAGDVNGDGYDEIIIAASHFDDGQTDEGQAYLYYGSPSGLSAAPGWTMQTDQANAYVRSVSTLGDANGDGFADVIVGSWRYDGDETDEGRVFAYYGSANGLSAIPNWTADGNQPGAGFGTAVGLAGDVNGDGYSDAGISASDFDNGQSNEGRVFVYHGSATGLGNAPNWFAESDQAGVEFSRNASTAGDVNGDGYADLILSARLYENGQSDEGAAFVYHGSANGLATSPSWIAEGNVAGGEFGYFAATAGDVNGDGYADAIVGARVSNQVFVYQGSQAGLGTTADWTFQLSQPLADFGSSVGTAGDVNGDGYADILVGANGYDGNQLDEGAAFVFYGNGGLGVSLNPRQRRANDSAPIAHLSRSNRPRQFRLALLGQTPFGRTRVKLEWEVKPLGVPFDGTAVQQSVAWMDTGTAGAQLSELVNGLARNTAYHWRVRLRYDPTRAPFQQTSRWLAVPWGGWNEEDLRSR